MDNEKLTISDLETMRDGDSPLLAGRYKVVRRLGEGGMGSVWLAEDTKLDGRQVAVKMLPAVLAGKKGAYRQVKQEALMAMKLSHPNIATVRAFEEDEGGSPFLVMDYIEGTGLDDILAEKGPLGEAETLKLLGPVSAALDYAHAKGVVHRDVKPGNVMVDRNGTPYVLDFGIAREIQETMTRVTGKFSSGTLLYMSPEQLNGRAPKAAQDVYSFAAMTYECLSGAPPFSRGQIEWQIVNNPPEPLPAEAGSVALRAGILSGLAKEPEGRPGTCAGVLGIARGESGASGGRGENGREGRPTARPQPNTDAATAGVRDGEGEVFLRKVRVGKAMKEAGGEDTTAEEKKALERVREVFAAGEEALKAEQFGAAGALFRKAEGELSEWQAGVAARREEEARREAEERREAKARAEAELRAEKQRLAEAQWKEEERTARKLAEEEARSKAGAIKSILLPGGATMAMVWCPPGSFMMGSPAGEEGRGYDEIQHPVTLTKGFWMAKYPVTQEQWRSVMGNNPAEHKGENLPVENVNWNDCMEFCQKAGNGMVLPTEAQWEYACRAGSMEAYGGTGQLEEMGWNRENSGNETHPVGQKLANAWGLYDMHGNVWEWCADRYGEYQDGPETDPPGVASGVFRVLRGGGYWGVPPGCRSAIRNWDNPGYRYRSYGFRPVSRDE